MNNIQEILILNDINDFLYTGKKVEYWINEQNYLIKIKRNIALLKISGQITKKNIDKVIEELIMECNNKYGTNFEYDNDYITTLDGIITYIEKQIEKIVMKKIEEKVIRELLEKICT